jgi:hypothetical protein
MNVSKKAHDRILNGKTPKGKTAKRDRQECRLTESRMKGRPGIISIEIVNAKIGNGQCCSFVIPKFVIRHFPLSQLGARLFCRSSLCRFDPAFSLPQK